MMRSSIHVIQAPVPPARAEAAGTSGGTRPQAANFVMPSTTAELLVRESSSSIWAQEGTCQQLLAPAAATAL